jgi:hypothetical protein
MGIYISIVARSRNHCCSGKVFLKVSDIKCHGNLSSSSRPDISGQKDGPTDMTNLIGQGSANIFCKGPNSKYFRLCGPRGKLEDIYVGRPT